MSTIADRYTLDRSLGEGGMARVFAATDMVLDRRVALKLLREDIGRDEILRERFLQESRLAARLNHRHIVRVFDAGVQGDVPWIAMELVDGESLREEMDRTGLMPTSRVVEVAEEVLAGLAAAHQAGVIHRDVKPANVLMGSEGAKLGDFGIAKSLQGGGDLTRTNQFMGTPKYTAPEVAMGLSASPQSDVYAAAVVFWEMLAGFPPYEHDNPLSLAMMHRTDPLPVLADTRPDLSLELLRALETALAKEPEDRPADALSFSMMLRAGLDGTGPAAPAEPVVREQTISLPRPALPQQASPPPVPLRPSPRPQSPASGSPKGAGVGLIALVTGLLLLAVVAFALSQSDLGDVGPTDPTATDAQSVTPATTGPAVTAPATSAPGSAETQATTPQTPAPENAPGNAPTTPAPAAPAPAPAEPAPTPTAAPTPVPVPEPTPDPPPTAAEPPVTDAIPQLTPTP